MSVIEFKKPKEQESCDSHGWQTGVAICAACRYEWVAVAPVGETLIQCPNCCTEKGRIKYAHSADTAWKCSCECDLFMITDMGTLCINCGKYQKF